MFAYNFPAFGNYTFGIARIVEFRGRISSFAFFLHEHFNAVRAVSPTRFSLVIAVTEHKARPAVSLFGVVSVNEFGFEISCFFYVKSYVKIVFGHVVARIFFGFNPQSVIGFENIRHRSRISNPTVRRVTEVGVIVFRVDAHRKIGDRSHVGYGGKIVNVLIPRILSFRRCFVYRRKPETRAR